MKVVKNNAYGGFGFRAKEEHKTFLYEYYDNDIKLRTDSELIEFVEKHPNECGSLVIVELPETTTDLYINDYDGFETIFYVVGGKIKTA